MSDIVDPKTIGRPLDMVSRRDFIKGVIASGAAVSSTGYLFRAPAVLGQTAGGTEERPIMINVNGQQRRADVMKQETLAWTLRHGFVPHRYGCP